MELLKIHLANSCEISPPVVVAVPGVVRVFGAFADIYSGLVLSASDDSSLYVAVSKRNDGLICYTNCTTGEHKKIQASSMKFRREDRWINYIRGAVEAVSSDIKNFLGLTVTVDMTDVQENSDIVRSAVTIGMFYALNKLFKLGMSTDIMIRKVSWVFSSFCTETVPFSDVVTMLYAKRNSFVLADIEKNEFELVENCFSKSGFELYLVDCRIPLQSFVEDIDSITSELVSAMSDFSFAAKKADFSSLSENLFRNAIENLKSDSRLLCLFLYGEYKNTLQIRDIFNSHDVELLGKMMSRIQKGIRENLELICPETDWVIKRAKELSSCTGACMINSGMGGFVAFVAKDSESDVFLEKLQDYERIFGFKAKFRKLNVGNKLRLIDVNNPCLHN